MNNVHSIDTQTKSETIFLYLISFALALLTVRTISCGRPLLLHFMVYSLCVRLHLNDDFSTTSKIVINATWRSNRAHNQLPQKKHTMKLKTCSKHSLRVRVAVAVVDDDDVIGRCASACGSQRWWERKKQATNQQNDERKRQSAYWCYYALQWFHLSLVCSFVLSVRLSVDGHIDFFVRFPSNGLPHIYVKNTSFYCLPCSLIHSSVSFYSAAAGTLTCYIWTQSNILCAGAVTCTWFVKSLKWWLK